MDSLWITNPTVLLTAPYMYQLIPMCDMTPNEYSNATIRLVMFITVILYFLYPNKMYWVMGIPVLAGLFVRDSRRRENFSYDTVKASLGEQLVTDKPVE